MKGKGEKGNRTSLTLPQVDEGSSTFATLKPFDHIKACPQFTSIASRDEDEYISVDELDSLQSEMEMILTCMTKRVKTFQAEVHALSSGVEKGKDKLGSSPSGALTPQSTGSMSSLVEQNHSNSSLVAHKRSGKGKSTEERPTKRMRTDSGRATYAQPVSSKGKGKQNHQDGGEVVAANQMKTPKNMTPNRFWAMVEPYCTEITKEDLRFLEEQIKFCEDVSEFMKTPLLGKHFAERWDEEDLSLEQGDGNKVADKKKNTNSIRNIHLADLNFERSNSDQEDVGVLYGPLTQRLVQALVEVDSNNGDHFAISDADAYEAATVPPKSLAKQLHIENPRELERRIKRELYNQGIFDSEDSNAEDDASSSCEVANKSIPELDGDSVTNNSNNNNNNDEDDDDEILMELRKKQSELKSLSVQNCQVLRGLLKLGREESMRQELRKKLVAADVEVEEAYRKLQVYKVKKKIPSKKEKDTFFKALQERKIILKQLHKSENRSMD